MKPKKPNPTITIKMTRFQALSMDLLICKCGHRVNNHFDFKKNACAHCDCEEYVERARFGLVIK